MSTPQETNEPRDNVVYFHNVGSGAHLRVSAADRDALAAHLAAKEVMGGLKVVPLHQAMFSTLPYWRRPFYLIRRSWRRLVRRLRNRSAR